MTGLSPAARQVGACRSPVAEPIGQGSLTVSVDPPTGGRLASGPLQHGKLPPATYPWQDRRTRQRWGVGGCPWSRTMLPLGAGDLQSPAVASAARHPCIVDVGRELPALRRHVWPTIRPACMSPCREALQPLSAYRCPRQVDAPAERGLDSDLMAQGFHLVPPRGVFSLPVRSSSGSRRMPESPQIRGTRLVGLTGSSD